MSDYSKLQQLLGPIEDTEESPYNTYDTMLREARNNALKRRSKDINTMISGGNFEYPSKDRNYDFRPDGYIDSLEKKQSYESPIQGIISKAAPDLQQTHENINNYVSQFPNRKILDRSPINDYIVDTILKSERPEIYNNQKYNKDNENLELANDTSKAIASYFYPKFEELQKRVSDGNFKQPTLNFEKPTRPYVYGTYNHKKNEITLHDDVKENPLKFSSTIPHELLHSLTDSYGSEHLPDLKHTNSSNLREMMHEGNNGHISSWKLTEDDFKKARLHDNYTTEPSGESAYYWKLIKEILKKEK